MVIQKNADMTDELFILNCADMSVAVDGANCMIAQRLEDIGTRYGIDSSEYRKAVLEIEKLQSDARYLKLK